MSSIIFFQKIPLSEFMRENRHDINFTSYSFFVAGGDEDIETLPKSSFEDLHNTYNYLY